MFNIYRIEIHNDRSEHDKKNTHAEHYLEQKTNIFQLKINFFRISFYYYFSTNKQKRTP